MLNEIDVVQHVKHFCDVAADHWENELRHQRGWDIVPVSINRELVNGAAYEALVQLAIQKAIGEMKSCGWTLLHEDPSKGSFDIMSGGIRFKGAGYNIVFQAKDAVASGNELDALLFNELTQKVIIIDATTSVGTIERKISMESQRVDLPRMPFTDAMSGLPSLCYVCMDPDSRKVRLLRTRIAKTERTYLIHYLPNADTMSVLSRFMERYMQHQPPENECKQQLAVLLSQEKNKSKRSKSNLR